MLHNGNISLEVENHNRREWARIELFYCDVLFFSLAGMFLKSEEGIVLLLHCSLFLICFTKSHTIIGDVFLQKISSSGGGQCSCLTIWRSIAIWIENIGLGGQWFDLVECSVIHHNHQGMNKHMWSNSGTVLWSCFTLIYFQNWKGSCMELKGV